MNTDRLVIRDTPTPDLIRLRAEMATRPDAYRIHLRAIDLVLAERGDADSDAPLVGHGPDGDWY